MPKASAIAITQDDADQDATEAALEALAGAVADRVKSARWRSTVLPLWTEVRAAKLAAFAGAPDSAVARSEVREARRAVAAALREAHEEVALAADGVDVVGLLPSLFIPVSGYAVTPVIAWWRDPSPVRVGDPQEVAEVLSVPVRYLVDPANRHTVVHPSGFRGPAWDLGDGLVLWGFTGGIINKSLELAGLAQEWDSTDERPLPERFVKKGS